MRSRFYLLLILCLAPVAALAAAAQPERHINLIQLDNQIVTPVMLKFVGEAIDKSEQDGAACLVITLDTPGGLLESTREIVKRIMNSKVPIVVYVAPSGSRAASAGVFITMAAHVAAMAPSTNIGAAHPIDLMGEDPKKIASKDTETTRSQGIHEQKLMNDMLAWAEGIAKTRGRNADWAKKAIIESVSIGNDEAVKLKVVDLVAQNTDDLLAKINGRAVSVNGTTVTLSTAGTRIDTIEMHWVLQVLSVVVHPNVAYVLMMLGILAIILEVTTGTHGFVGVTGAICLILAFYAFHYLPTSYAALGLVLIGIGMLIAEIKIVSHGFLAIGGMISLLLGSMLLFESPAPALRVSLSLILAIVVTVGCLILFLVSRALRSQAMPAATGATGMVGEVGRAMTALNPGGQVFVHGEIWRATATVPVEENGSVRVVEVDGLHIKVEPIGE